MRLPLSRIVAPSGREKQNNFACDGVTQSSCNFISNCAQNWLPRAPIQANQGTAVHEVGFTLFASRSHLPARMYTFAEDSRQARPKLGGSPTIQPIPPHISSELALCRGHHGWLPRCRVACFQTATTFCFVPGKREELAEGFDERVDDTKVTSLPPFLPLRCFKTHSLRLCLPCL